MARLLFLQLNDYELHGPQSISAVARAQGHSVSLVIPSFERKPWQAIQDFDPQVVGFSLATVERAEAFEWAAAVKQRTRALVLMGGVDPTFYPEMVDHPAVDLVCRGEGEEAVAELLTALDQDGDFTRIPGLWAKRNGRRFENPVRPLIEALDTLPFPDKSLYLERYPHFRDYPIKFFLAGRGCPYGCTYCANYGLRNLYPNRQRYVRFKSPAYLLTEMRQVLGRYPARTVGFNDDLFTFDEEWMADFLEGYRREAGRPFFCCGRVDTMTEAKARLLKESGCYSLWYGLESAKEETRRKILNRQMSDEAIRRGTRLLKDQGLQTQSYNMLNIPGEGLAEGLATLRFNRELHNDFVVASLFQPFPGTELTRELIASGKLQDVEDFSSREKLSYFAFSPLEQPERRELMNLQKLFVLGHWFPRLEGLIRRLVRLPPNPVFDIIFLVCFAVDYGRSHHLRLSEVARYHLRHLRTTYFRRRRKVWDE